MSTTYGDANYDITYNGDLVLAGWALGLIGMIVCVIITLVFLYYHFATDSPRETYKYIILGVSFVVSALCFATARYYYNKQATPDPFVVVNSEPQLT